MKDKTFKDKINMGSPAEQFISTEATAAPEPGEGTQPPQVGTIPEGYKLVPIEKKTQRVQLVFRPSIAQRAKEAAKAQGISFNELCSIAIEEYLNK